MTSKEIKMLIDAGIIDEKKGVEIEAFFQKENEKAPNRIFIVFGLIGAILIGLGLVAIVASNWDGFSKIIKTFFAFIPLIIAQCLCFYTLTNKSDSKTWRECTATLLIFAFGSGLILLTEIYGVTINHRAYILIWILLSIPIVYLLNSAMSSLLCYVGIMIYCGEFTSLFYNGESYFFILLILAIMPFYYKLIKENPEGNFTRFHHLIFPITILYCIATLLFDHEGTIPLYFLLFASIGLTLSNFPLFKLNEKNNNKTLFILGALVLTGSVFFYSFYDFWKRTDILAERALPFYGGQSFIILIIFLSIAIFLLFRARQKNINLPFLSYLFLAAVPSFFIGLYQPLVGTILFNFLAAVIGIYFIQEGNSKNHLGILNVGMIMIAAIIAFRFMDIDVKVAWKGLVFIIIGIGFFVANYLMLKKRKPNV